MEVKDTLYEKGYYNSLEKKIKSRKSHELEDNDTKY